MSRAKPFKTALTAPPVSAALVALAVLAVAEPGKPAKADDAPPAAPAKAIVARACQGCHELGQVTEARHTPQEWAGVIQRMRANGADLTDSEAKEVQAYLAKTYAKDH
ncbi:hypothetical protein [uncultured Caulobacter sp.]|uniref:hypothetical protein n=1 Tax=uncultured Caulobacter sp. TaxID=158749 RepID=UPI00262E8AF9|nr:hypothetical protein [uncultured Caulobacter sp.]